MSDKLVKPVRKDLDTNRTQRRTLRLKEYDYSSAGAYFVTLCAFQRNCLFGKFGGKQINLSQTGEILHECWRKIPSHFKNASLDEFVIMPNHFHGIIVIFADSINRAEHVQPLQREINISRFQHVAPNSLSTIVRSFKAAVTRLSRWDGTRDSIWQRNYYEHVIRNERELEQIRSYILNNPLKWNLDRENPESQYFNLDHDEYYKEVYLLNNSRNSRG